MSRLDVNVGIAYFGANALAKYEGSPRTDITEFSGVNCGQRKIVSGHSLAGRLYAGQISVDTSESVHCMSINSYGLNSFCLVYDALISGGLSKDNIDAVILADVSSAM